MTDQPMTLREKIVPVLCVIMRSDGPSEGDACKNCPANIDIPGHGPGTQLCRRLASGHADRILALIEAEGYRKVADDHVVVPKHEVTEEMLRVGREVMLAKECVGKTWTLGQHVDEGGYNIPLEPHERALTYLPKEGWAALVWRSMLAAAPEVQP